MGGNYEELLDSYKSLIDFSDKDQKNNFKWLVSYLGYQTKNYPEIDNTQFLLDAIDLQSNTFVRKI
jgi:hypothetical protein